MQLHSVMKTWVAAGVLTLLAWPAAHAVTLTPQQIWVTAANSFGNSVYNLTLSSAGLINGTQAVNTDGSSGGHELFDALVWVPNSATGTLDLIVADAAKSQIVRYSGPSYGTSTPIFTWSKTNPGPNNPV